MVLPQYQAGKDLFSTNRLKQLHIMKITLLFLAPLLFFTSCIKDDFVADTVEPLLRIDQAVDTLAINTAFRFTALYLNNVGTAEEVSILWQSSDTEIISIAPSGLAQALQTGSAVITATFNDGNQLVQDSIEVHVGEETVIANSNRSGVIATTSSYLLRGDFTLSAVGSDLELSIADNYRASTSLPGLYVYLTNNPNTIANAYEIGPVTTFSGAHSYTIPATGINDYNYVLYFCRPFNVKVGDGEIQ